MLYYLFAIRRSVMPLTQPKTDLAYLRSEKAKAEQKLRSCQHREKILERRMSELNRRERVHRLCTRAGMLESFLVCPGELTDDQVMELLKISFRQPEVVLASTRPARRRRSSSSSRRGGSSRRAARRTTRFRAARRVSGSAPASRGSWRPKTAFREP